MRILVTGTSGFIGSAIASRIKTEGIEVHGLSRNASRENCVDFHHFHDLRNPFQSTVNYDCVIHCAALCRPWAKADDYFQTNILGLKHLIQFCTDSGLPHLVFISSSSVHYENKDQFEIHEETSLPHRTISEYAKSKQQGEKLVQSYQGKWTILRPRAVYGPGDTMLLPRVLKAAKANQLPYFVRPDGKSVYMDLLYIENFTHSVLQAVKNKTLGTFILTNNETVILNDFLQSLLSQVHYPEMKRKISVSTAMKIATLAEWVSCQWMNDREPPITRFGVSMFAYSKTFNVQKSISAFGPPPFSNQEGLNPFIKEWMDRGT